MERRADFSDVTQRHENLGICTIPLNVAVIFQKASVKM